MSSYDWILTAALVLVFAVLVAVFVLGFALIEIIGGAFALLAILTTKGVYS